MTTPISQGDLNTPQESTNDSEAYLVRRVSSAPLDEVAPTLCPQKHLKTVECHGESNSPICINVCPIGLRRIGKEF